MKYYFPTSSINLDNILQSECILPPAHYSQRISGYKSFEQIEELRSVNSIILFNHPIQFTINDSGRYNFPILIEIEDEYQCNDLKNPMNGVFVCNHAINLTPFNCRIYFFTKQAYDLTIINTRSNKSIKYFEKYTIRPNTFGLKTIPLLTLAYKDIAPLPCEDKYVDKQKGATYAYLLGQKLSLSSELASLFRLNQDIYNILTSLIATPSTFATFRTKLSKLVEDYKSVDNIEKESQIVFNNELDKVLGKRFKFLKENFINALKNLGLWNICFDSLCKKWNCHLLPNIDTLSSSSDFVMLRNEIERRTASNISKHQSIIKESLQGLSINGYHVAIENMNLINKVIEYIIDNDLTPELLSAHRMSVYMNIMNSIVPIIQTNIGINNWEKSSERDYINNLYAHIDNPSVPFNVNSINNDEIRAIACFILRGHSFSDLTVLLKLNAIEDYRASLVLWGTLCGYYGMNREALEPVLSDVNYKSIYNKLFGKELGKITNDSFADKSQSHSREDDFKDYKFILEKFKKFKEPDKFVDEIIARSKSACVSINEAIDYVCSNKLKRAKKQCELAKIAYKLLEQKEDEANLAEYINKEIKEKSLTAKSRNEILAHFGFVKIKTKKNINTIKAESELFSSESDVGNDENTLSNMSLTKIEDTPTSNSKEKFYPEKLPKLQCLQNMPENVLRRLEKNWMFTKEQHPTDRLENIRHFVNLCKKEGREGCRKGNTELKDVFTEELAQQVEPELLDYFNVR